ncbi:MAG: PIN domain-containing protein [Shinella sp.]|nr:PIN domain-containing protein [Shinella sp.]
MPGSFIDTNVIVYLASADAEKADRAEKAISEGGAISVQVLNEFVNVARRKMKLSWNDIHEFLSYLRELLDARPVTVAVHENGLRLAERYSLSTYDAMIVSAAIESNCDVLLSEDLQDGLLIENRLRVVNPFRKD